MSGRARLSLSNTVLLSLSLLTERVSYRSLSRRFHLEKGNIHRIFFSFCERVNTLEEKLIKWPTGRLISVFVRYQPSIVVIKDEFVFQTQRLQRSLFHSADRRRFRRSSRSSLRSWACWDIPLSPSACQLGRLM